MIIRALSLMRLCSGSFKINASTEKTIESIVTLVLSATHYSIVES
jgi:hypothetical protein